MALKFLEEDGSLHPFRQTVNGMLLQKSCCRRTFVRGAFLASGSMSDPHKSYHFEIVCATPQQAEQLKMCIRDRANLNKKDDEEEE